MSDVSALIDNFVRQTAGDRAHYREQATQLRQLAEAEQTPTFRESLFEVAAQYERLADEVSAD